MGEACQVTVLDAGGVSYDAKTVDRSGRGLQVALEHRLALGTAVKVEMKDTLLLAEVCFAAPVTGGYIAGLKIDQILTGLADLTRLNLRLGFIPARGEHREVSQFAERCGVAR